MAYEPNWTPRKTYGRWDQPATLLGEDPAPQRAPQRAPEHEPVAPAEPAAPKRATTKSTPTKRAPVKRK